MGYNRTISGMSSMGAHNGEHHCDVLVGSHPEHDSLSVGVESVEGTSATPCPVAVDVGCIGHTHTDGESSCIAATIN